MEIREFLFRKDSRTTTVPFPPKPIYAIKCKCGFDGLASQLVKDAYGTVLRCPLCGEWVICKHPIFKANGDEVDFNE